MSYVAVRGKQKILDFFGKQKNPIWRLYPADDPRSIIADNYTTTDFTKASALLRDVVEYLDGDNVYTLESFKATQDKKYGTKPDNAVNFTVSDGAVGEIVKPAKPGESFQGDIKKNFDLVIENSTLRSEKGILQFKYDQLLLENQQLKKDIEELEDELDEMTADLAEDKLNGTDSEDPIKKQIASAIEKGTNLLIENFGNMKKPENKLDPEIKINGIRDETYKKHPIEKYIELLMKADPDLHFHFYKLVQLAQQKPETFKMLLTQLENQ